MNTMSVFTIWAALMALTTLVLLTRPWRLGTAGDAGGKSAPLSMSTTLGLVILIPLATGMLYGFLGNRMALAVADGSDRQGLHPTGTAEIDRMVQSLARKLEKNPEDAKGWAMLARSWKVMGRYGEAEQAFARAGQVVEGDADLLTEYADVVAMRNGGQLAGKAADLVNKALAVAPDHPTALWMAGTAAYQRKDYVTARQDWLRLLKLLPADSPDREVIRANLEEIRLLRGEPRERAVQEPRTTVTDQVAHGESVGAKTSPPVSSGRSAIRGTVRLAPQLAAKVSPDDAVFVFARTVDGPHMPLAVLRARAADLPLDFVLDSSNAMNPEMTLEKAGMVVVEARVSKHGDAKLQPGDLLGMRNGVKVGAKGTAIVIDQVKPL